MRAKRRQNQQLTKKITRIAAIAIGATALLFVAAGGIAKFTITRGFLIDEIENTFNSDAQIGSADVSVFSFPARIVLNDVRLSPREEEATANDALLLIERVDLKVSLWALLIREINVKSIIVSGADITTTYRKDGSTSIGDLFDKPDDRSGRKKDKSGRKKRRGFNAFEQQKFVAALGSLTIEHSRANVLLERMGVKLLCSHLNAELSEMRVDPKRLQETDAAQLSFSVDIRSDSIKGWENGELFLKGEASARIFNPDTGATELDIEGDISISEQSWLNARIPIVTKAWAQLEILEKIGVKVAKLPERARYGRSEAIAAHYHLGVITVRKPLSIWVGDWELAALDGSWLDTGSGQHEIHGELLASESASDTFITVISKGLSIFPEKVRPAVMKDITAKLYRDKRLLVPVKSTGDFSDPKVRPSGAVPDLAESAKGALKDLVKDKGEELKDEGEKLKEKGKRLLDDLLNRD